MSGALDPRLIPHHKKTQYLEQFSEDDFRDKVVRPLLLLQGLTHGKETCGSDEEGKDCYFWQDDAIRGRTLVAVQTKKGDLKLSSKARDNLLNATTQVRTALDTPIYDSFTKQKHFPSCVILAASGEINSSARKHVTEEIKDPRIVFKDANIFIPDIDKYMPEFWNGIDADMLPYLKNLRESLLSSSITIDVTAIGLDVAAPSPITDDAFAQIFVNRIYPSTKRESGEIKDKLEVEDIRVQDLLQRRERLILLTGDAGSGKSTALYRLGLLLIDECLRATKGFRIPVVLLAKDVLHTDSNLAVFAGNHTKTMTINSAPAFDVEMLEGGRVELLIDGLDELGSADQRTAVLDKIRNFHASYPSCQIILSSRDYLFVREIVAEYNYTRFRITPISLQQASKMIARLSKGQSLSSDETIETLRRLEDVHGLQLNPLLITVFVATSDYSRSDIPANITEIFKKFTEVMLGRWGVSKGISQQYQTPLKDFLLRRIAFDMHANRETTISISRCKAIIDDELRQRGHEADIDTLFDEIVFRSGCLGSQFKWNRRG